MARRDDQAQIDAEVRAIIALKNAQIRREFIIKVLTFIFCVLAIICAAMGGYAYNKLAKVSIAGLPLTHAALAEAEAERALNDPNFVDYEAWDRAHARFYKELAK